MEVGAVDIPARVDQRQAEVAFSDEPEERGWAISPGENWNRLARPRDSTVARKAFPSWNVDRPTILIRNGTSSPASVPTASSSAS